MARVFCVFLLFLSVANCSLSTVSNVNLVDYREYFQKFAAEFVKMIEEKHWSNLQLPNMEQEINSTIFGQQVLGTVSYTNGFVVSVQSVDILPSSMQQRFIFTNETEATVQVSGNIRVVSLTVGFDVDAEVNDHKRHYTGASTFPLLHNNFVILKDLFRNTITMTCTTSVQGNPSAMRFLPSDSSTDIMTSTYTVTSANAGVVEWGKVFESIGQEVASTKIEFPDICYNCPIS